MDSTSISGSIYRHLLRSAYSSKSFIEVKTWLPGRYYLGVESVLHNLELSVRGYQFYCPTTLDRVKPYTLMELNVTYICRLVTLCVRKYPL